MNGVGIVVGICLFVRRNCLSLFILILISRFILILEVLVRYDIGVILLKIISSYYQTNFAHLAGRWIIVLWIVLFDGQGPCAVIYLIVIIFLSRYFVPGTEKRVTSSMHRFIV